MLLSPEIIFMLILLLLMLIFFVANADNLVGDADLVVAYDSVGEADIAF